MNTEYHNAHTHIYTQHKHIHSHNTHTPQDRATVSLCEFIYIRITCLGLQYMQYAYTGPDLDMCIKCPCTWASPPHRATKNLLEQFQLSTVSLQFHKF